jgi:zinc transport system substrate-binding protein
MRHKIEGIMKRCIVMALILCALVVPASAQAPAVVASTPWAAAVARAAGAQNVRTLAPKTMQNPLAHELSAEDLNTLREANWIVYTGLEGFAAELMQAPKGSAELIRIDGSASPENATQQAARLAEMFGTTAAYQEWAGDFAGASSRVKAAINVGYPEETRVIVHPDARPIAEWLGFEIAGEIGPKGVSSDTLKAMVDRFPEIMLDSYHDPAGTEAAEAAETRYAELLIHPGPEQTETLEDVMRHNQGLLVSYALPEEEETSTSRLIPWLAGGAVGFLLLLVLAFFGLRRLAKS